MPAAMSRRNNNNILLRGLPCRFKLSMPAALSRRSNNKNLIEFQAKIYDLERSHSRSNV
jgi:hypothetical protein